MFIASSAMMMASEECFFPSWEQQLELDDMLYKYAKNAMMYLTFLYLIATNHIPIEWLQYSRTATNILPKLGFLSSLLIRKSSNQFIFLNRLNSFNIMFKTK